MRLDHVSHAQGPAVRAPGHAATKAVAAAATAKAAVVAPAAADTAATGPAGATLSVTATWQWSASLQVGLALHGDGATAAGAAPTAETAAAAPDHEVGRADGRRHGRAHVSQLLHQLGRAVRQELRAIIRENPDLDPAVREELRGAAQAFRDDLKSAFHAAGRGHDFDPAALLDGVQQALATLADRLGALIDDGAQAPEPVPAPAPEPLPAPEPEVPTAEIPADTPVTTAS